MNTQVANKNRRGIVRLSILLFAVAATMSGGVWAGVCQPSDPGCLPSDPPPPYECNHECAATCYNDLMASCEALGRDHEDCGRAYATCIASCGCLNPEIPMTQTVPGARPAVPAGLLAVVNARSSLQSRICGQRAVALAPR